jgi:hypothetical protein
MQYHDMEIQVPGLTRSRPTRKQLKQSAKSGGKTWLIQTVNQRSRTADQQATDCSDTDPVKVCVIN